MILLVFTPSAYSDTSLDIKFISNDIIDIDQDQTSVIIQSIIENYNPSDGYFYSKITDPHGNIIINSEVFVEYWKNGLWHIITGYSVNKYDYQNQYDVLGNWSITIYNESGTVSKSVSFTVIASDTLTNDTMENDPNSEQNNTDTTETDITETDRYWWIAPEDDDAKPDTTKPDRYWWIAPEPDTTKPDNTLLDAINPDLLVNDNSFTTQNTLDDNYSVSQNISQIILTEKDIAIPQSKNAETDSIFLLDSYVVLIILLIVFFVFAILIILKKYKKKSQALKISKYVWFKILPKPKVFEDDIFAEKLENLKEFGLVIYKKEKIQIFVRVLYNDAHHITSLKGLTAEMLKETPDIQFATIATTLKLKHPFLYPLTIEKKKCRIYDTSTEVSDFVIGINGISCDPSKIKKSAEKYINSKSKDKGWESGVSAIKKKAEAEKFFSCEIFYAGDILSEVESVINFTGDTSPNSLVNGKKRDIKKILESTPSASFFGKPCILSVVEISSIIGFPDDARDIPVEHGTDDTHVSGNAIVHNLDDDFECMEE